MKRSKPRGLICAGLRGALLICAGAVFFSLVFLALTSLTTVDLLVNERGLVVKESLGGYYRPVSYYLSKGEPQPSVPTTLRKREAEAKADRAAHSAWLLCRQDRRPIDCEGWWPQVKAER